LDYLREANEKTFVIVQIEDPEAIDNIEKIAGVDGIDALFVGPTDLAHGLGVLGQMGHPKITEAINRVADACGKNKKHWGTPVSLETAPKYLEMGARFLTLGADVLGLREYYSGLRQHLGELGVEFSTPK
jgi:4-hydroxy-2-oxoheptanedioate aldolase